MFWRGLDELVNSLYGTNVLRQGPMKCKQSAFALYGYVSIDRYVVAFGSILCWRSRGTEIHVDQIESIGKPASVVSSPLRSTLPFELDAVGVSRTNSLSGCSRMPVVVALSCFLAPFPWSQGQSAFHDCLSSVFDNSPSTAPIPMLPMTDLIVMMRLI